MARFRGLILGVLLVFACFGVSSLASADQMFTSQAEAYAQCMADGAPNHKCTYGYMTGPGYGGNPVCAGPPYNGWSSGAGYSNTYEWYKWCVPEVCNAGTSGPGGQKDYAMPDPGGFLGGGGVADQGGCCVSLDRDDDPNFQSGWSAADKSDGWAFGHFRLTGDRCSTTIVGGENQGAIPNPAPIRPYSHCPTGQASCFNPFDNNFCSQSDSGEWFCVPRSPGETGNCGSGATGSTCYGKDPTPPPTPPDPPIQKGTSPDTTNNYTINDSTTTNNYTTNNYSGTSDGGSSGGAPASGGTTAQNGGNQSNIGGNGNTGKNGTDSSGNCPNGSKPTASGCSGTYTDNGCNTPPACYGDAVMCGQARELHAIKCNSAHSMCRASQR